VVDLTYQFRLGLRQGVETYTLTDDALIAPGGRLALADIAAIRVYGLPGLRSFGYGELFGPMHWGALRRGGAQAADAPALLALFTSSRRPVCTS